VVPILSQIDPVHTTPYNLRSILILCLDLPSGLFPSGFPPISYMHSSSPDSCHMPCQSHPPLFDHSNYTWRRVQVVKLLIMQYFQPSCHLIPLRSKYSPSNLFSNTLSLCSSLNVREQVSHPYKTTGKIIILYILIHTFSDSRREHKSFCTEW
jgi:hypothetical protein